MKQPDTLLELRDVSKIYYDKQGHEIKRALKQVSFDLKKGEIFGLLGVNGAGKTTLSSILATMHPLTIGEVLWKGKSIYDQLLEYRQIIGSVPQKPNIEKRLTVEENLLFAGYCYGLGRKEALERKQVLMEQFHLEEYATSHAEQLSGGYRQRLLIARALMHHPQLLILDEPTVGLDPHIRRHLWELIKDLKRLKHEVTIILTTHYLDEAEVLSDRVCMLHRGVIKTIDSPEHLKRVYQKDSLEEVFLKLVEDPEGK